MSSIPIRCYTCGKVTGNKWEPYKAYLEDKMKDKTYKKGITEYEALDSLGLKRYCCRRILLGNVDVNELLLSISSQK